MQRDRKVLIIGAGPAGLTAGWKLIQKRKYKIVIVDQDSMVGGLAKTIPFKGCLFDVGPHHFVTNSEEILALWKFWVGDKFMKLDRFTRILYKGHFFKYPLEIFNVLSGLSFVECLKIVGSYFWYRIFPYKNPRSFEQWMINRFGYHLYKIFFKSYTEKVWGISCNKISADWASQRIQNFSLGAAIIYLFLGRFIKKSSHRTLSKSFYYPIKGSGSLWELVASDILDAGEEIFLSQRVVRIEHHKGVIKQVFTSTKGEKSGLRSYKVDYLLSSMALKDLLNALSPKPPQEVVAAAQKLRYRGLITINFVVQATDVIPDHWLYIHDKRVKLGRIGNMNNFSKQMVLNNENCTALSLEYFSFYEDKFWQKSDEEIINIGKTELNLLGIVKKNKIIAGKVLRFPQAYPVYDLNYKKNLDIVFGYLKTIKNIFLMGRSGMHCYNNMDIAMMSAIQAVDEIEKKSRKDFVLERFDNLQSFYRKKRIEV